AAHRNGIRSDQSSRNAHRNGFLAVENAQLADDLAEVKVCGPRFNAQLDRDINARHAVRCHFETLRFSRGQGCDADHQRWFMVDKMRHEKIVERHREKDDCSEMCRNESLSRLVDWRNWRIQGNHHAAVIRVPKRYRHTAAY